MSIINITALGGVQETGKNLYIVDVDDSLFILDAGMKYPSSDIYGVDLVLPDLTYLVNNCSKIKGIFLSHAHDDHIAAVPHILKYMKLPVYASAFTLSVVKELLIEHNINPNEQNLITVSENKILHFGRVEVKFINVNHSVPQSLAIVIGTEDGNIVYTGNYNFDQNGKSIYRTNLEKLCKVANEKVLALMPESIGALKEINRGSISEFVGRLNKVFMSAKGRIIISLFSTNLQRIQQIVDMAVEFGKKVAILGRKTQRIVNIAINSGYLDVDLNRLINLRYIDDKNQNNQSDLVVLVTGERHEPYFMLQRMCKKVDRLVRIDGNDTVVILTRPAIGTEKMAARTLDMLYRETDNVVIVPTSLILSASSGPEESKQMINITRPKFVLPVIGEYRHQYNMVNLARSVGIKDENIKILELGNTITFKNKEYIGVTKVVPYGDILLDGKGLGDVNNAVIRDRELLAESGVLMLVANVNAKTRKVVSGPEFVAKGFYYDSGDVSAMNNIFENITEKVFETKFINWNEYKGEIKSELAKYVYRKTHSSPIIIPVIISTEIAEKEEK